MEFLAARPEIGGISVGVDLPSDFDGSQRAVVVSRLGGEYRSDDGLDAALAKVDTYGPDKISAHAVAGAVRGVLPLLPMFRNGSGSVTDVEEEQGPCWSPDRRRDLPYRYVMRYLLVVAVRPSQA